VWQPLTVIRLTKSTWTVHRIDRNLRGRSGQLERKRERQATQMKVEFQPLDGRFVRLEPFAPELKAEVREAIDCDPETWAIMPVNPMGKGFETYWSATCGARSDDRMAYAIRRRSDGRVVGMSTYYMTLAGHRGVEIGPLFSIRMCAADSSIRKQRC
jgi:hypothetical protein